MKPTPRPLGRPPLPPGKVRVHRWSATFTEVELAAVEAARPPGVARADWLLALIESTP